VKNEAIPTWVHNSIEYLKENGPVVNETVLKKIAQFTGAIDDILYVYSLRVHYGKKYK
jgi:hypothetical protein